MRNASRLRRPPAASSSFASTVDLLGGVRLAEDRLRHIAGQRLDQVAGLAEPPQVPEGDALPEVQDVEHRSEVGKLPRHVLGPVGDALPVALVGELLRPGEARLADDLDGLALLGDGLGGDRRENLDRPLDVVPLEADRADASVAFPWISLLRLKSCLTRSRSASAFFSSETARISAREERVRHAAFLLLGIVDHRRQLAQGAGLVALLGQRLPEVDVGRRCLARPGEVPEDALELLDPLVPGGGHGLIEGALRPHGSIHVDLSFQELRSLGLQGRQPRETRWT